MNKNLVVILSILILPLCFYYYLNKSQAVSAVKVPNSKPVVIEFYSDMCGECKKMEQVVNIVYPKYSDRVTLVQVPVHRKSQDIQNLVKEYDVSLVPTIIFRKSNGTIMERFEGYMDNATFETKLRRLYNE